MLFHGSEGVIHGLEIGDSRLGVGGHPELMSLGIYATEPGEKGLP